MKMTEELSRDFVRLATGPQPDLAAAALVIGRLEYPRLSPAPYLARLDEMGAAAAGRVAALGRGATALARVEAVTRYLFDEEGFTGNRDRYDDPRNSFLNEVLDRRTGIPITLAVVFMEVARRAGVPVAGVNFPGHFLLQCEAGEAGWSERVILDPFHGGVQLSEIDCRRLLRQHLGDEAAFDRRLLEPATQHQILVRMLVNLKRIYVRNRSFPQAHAVTELLVALDPAAVTELRDRGLLAYHLRDFSRALQDLETYLTLSGRVETAETPEEREQIWEHVKTLRRRVAGFN